MKTLAEKIKYAIQPTKNDTNPMGGLSVFVVNGQDASLTEVVAISDEGVFMTHLGMRVPTSEAEVRVFVELDAWRTPLDATSPVTVAEILQVCNLERVTYEDETVHLLSDAKTPHGYEMWIGDERIEYITETQGVVSFVNTCDEATELKLTDDITDSDMTVYRVIKEKVY